jgi:hypothetical protein
MLSEAPKFTNMNKLLTINTMVIMRMPRPSNSVTSAAIARSVVLGTRWFLLTIRPLR